MRLMSDHVQHTNELADLSACNTGYDFIQSSVSIFLLRTL